MAFSHAVEVAHDRRLWRERRGWGNALAFALRFQRSKRVHNADEIMAEIVAQRLVEHFERAGFVVMKRPSEIGAATLGRGFEG